MREEIFLQQGASFESKLMTKPEVTQGTTTRSMNIDQLELIAQWRNLAFGTHS